MSSPSLSSSRLPFRAACACCPVGDCVGYTVFKGNTPTYHASFATEKCECGHPWLSHNLAVDAMAHAKARGALPATRCAGFFSVRHLDTFQWERCNSHMSSRHSLSIRPPGPGALSVSAILSGPRMPFLRQTAQCLRCSGAALQALPQRPR
ncbi:hypothetical protein FA95DRAFT_562664 [Auriscalpium vulgare]|uniref:Uncharacterized protein n=1 Tax=Auriscalpium vulgare TaxID=40419 RepID=A0ACB8RF39_9AGAM|nr:hypothetical protein FA95DRAFT_562664 [Auriscalpium vulgare]